MGVPTINGRPPVKINSESPSGVPLEAPAVPPVPRPAHKNDVEAFRKAIGKHDHPQPRIPNDGGAVGGVY